MPVILSFCEDGYVVYVAVEDPWAVNDILSLYEQEKAHYDKVSHKVHALYNLSKVRQMPTNALAAARGNPALYHPNRGQMAIVGAKSFTRTIAEIITRVARFDRIVFFDTDEQAWKYLRELIVEEQGEEQKA